MYKGHRLTKHLKRYIGYAETKYQKLSIHYNVDLWEVLESYDLINEQADCLKWYVYDKIKGEGVYEDAYKVTRAVNGCIYVKEVFEENTTI